MQYALLTKNGKDVNVCVTVYANVITKQIAPCSDWYEWKSDG